MVTRRALGLFAGGRQRAAYAVAQHLARRAAPVSARILSDLFGWHRSDCHRVVVALQASGHLGPDRLADRPPEKNEAHLRVRVADLRVMRADDAIGLAQLRSMPALLRAYERHKEQFQIRACRLAGLLRQTVEEARGLLRRLVDAGRLRRERERGWASWFAWTRGRPEEAEQARPRAVAAAPPPEQGFVPDLCDALEAAVRSGPPPPAPA